MSQFTLTWETLLLAVVLATAVYLLEAALFSRRRRSDPSEAGKRLEHLDQDVAAIHQRVSELERGLRELREALEQARLAQEQAAREAAERLAERQSTPYAQAVELAREGASAQELARRCGITNGEAELIVALNRGGP